MDVEPSSFTLVSVMTACSGLKALKLGKAVHGYSLRNLGENDVTLDNAILDFYRRSGSLVNAHHLFVNMSKRDVFHGLCLLGAMHKKGFCEEAVRLFQEMVEGKEAEPNEVTIINLLSACSSVGVLNLGEWIHSYIERRHDFVEKGNVGSALINMYVKCGHLSMALEVFNSLESKDIISWSTIMRGMAMCGHGKQVLQLFSLMLFHGITPDGVVFVGLLGGCSHVGLIDRGLMLFNAMKGVYGIEPRVQHYARVVDMYGGAGCLEAAEAFIKEMPIEADPAVWGALLNACTIYGNNKIIERIRHCVGNGGDASIGTLALLSNSYASSDRWSKSDKVRDEMRYIGVKKVLGRSWIETQP